MENTPIVPAKQIVDLSRKPDQLMENSYAVKNLRKLCGLGPIKGQRLDAIIFCYVPDDVEHNATSETWYRLHRHAENMEIVTYTFDPDYDYRNHFDDSGNPK